MPYETKPMKKQWLEVDGRLTPIILPQIWNHELQDWVVTSEQNPLPTQLTGSNVEEVIVADAVASADVERTSVELSTARYSEYDFLIDNSLNEDIKIRFIFGKTAVRLVKTDGTVVPMGSNLANAISIPSGARHVLLSLFSLNEENLVDEKQWMRYKEDGLEIEYSAEKKPTTGAVTIKLQGVLYNAK